MRSRPLKNIVRQQWATQHLSALLQKMVDFKEKKHSSTIITLKVCWHWNVKVCSLSHFFFIFLFWRKPHFAKQCSLLQRPLHLTYCGLKHTSSIKKAGKFEWKFPNCLMSWFCCLIIISTIIKYFFHYIVVT